MPTVLDPILGLVWWILSPSGSQNTAVAKQVYYLRAEARIFINQPAKAKAQTTYTLTVPIMHLKSPSKLEVLADGMDTVYFEEMPIPTHWQVFVGGRSMDEFDFYEPYFEATFNPGGLYRIIIGSEGYETSTFDILAVDVPPEQRAA